MTVINAQPARISHHYEKTKEKLLETKAAIWVNIMWRFQYLTPKPSKLMKDTLAELCICCTVRICKCCLELEVYS